MKKPFFVSRPAVFPWLLLLSGMFLLSSCAWLFRSIVFPNQCQQCQLQDDSGGVLWSEDECGGNVAGMETRCKVRAYDEFIMGRRVQCVCETYRKAAEE